MADVGFNGHHIDTDLLRHYVTTWQRVNAEIDTIHSMAGLLALLDHGTEDKLTVESHCLAHVFRLIDRSAVNICAILDDFIGIGEARAAVAESTNKEAGDRI